MSRLKQFWGWIQRIWTERREFSLGGLIRRISVLLMKWIGVAVTLGLGPILISRSLATSEKKFVYIWDAFRQADISLPSFAGVTTIIVLLNEARVYLQETQKPNEESIEALVQNLFSGALEETFNTDGQHPDPIKSLLQRIENAVVAIIGQDAVRASISSNVMSLKMDDRGFGTLWLTRWGNQLADREVLGLELNSDLPGAPAAFLQRRVIYVADTQAPEYKKYFEGKSYRCIVSIPIFTLSSTRQICGIINIDATRPNLFRSEAYIESEIVPRLKPFVNLIAAQWERV